MTDEILLGIDTSNYTTSVALVSLDAELVHNGRRLLAVKEGERGLRQSDATFAHIKNLPELMEMMAEVRAERKIVAVGVSSRPRNVDGSYMPCFLAGVNAAVAIAMSSGIPLYTFSHQCGHIEAALFSSCAPVRDKESFAAFHISGGTTELLRVRPDDVGFTSELVGGTKDLNAGQVIDRIGVMLGCSFPAGGALDALASEYKGRIPRKKPSVKGMDVSLSGLENLATKLYFESGDKALTAAFVFDYLGSAISEMTRAYISAYGDTPVVYAGGVMRNSIIRKRLADEFDAYFATPDTSSDNAVGIASLARRAFLNDK